MRTQDKINRLCFNLFQYKGKYFYKNIKDIPTFFSRLKFVIKHGYYPQAEWETFCYFIDIFIEIISTYRYERNGTPVITGDIDKDEKDFNLVLEEMLNCLQIMKKYDSIDIDDIIINKAKDKFFKLFSKYFYDLWD